MWNIKCKLIYLSAVVAYYNESFYFRLQLSKVSVFHKYVQLQYALTSYKSLLKCFFSPCK